MMVAVAVAEVVLAAAISASQVICEVPRPARVRSIFVVFTLG
jgi:hypothetical protein